MNLQTLEVALDEKKKKPDSIDWATFDLSNCQRCKLCLSGRKNVVKPVIVENCKIMFIGEANGAEEDRVGLPFVGPAGQLFDKCLEQVGINRHECSIHNVISCRPPRNREPEKDEIQACYEILEKAIEVANPQIIVPLGNVAFKRICKKTGITKYNGQLVESKLYPDKKIIPVVHPSFALRDPANIDLLLFGLNKVKQLADNDGVSKIKYSKVTYVDTYERFQEMIKDLRSKPYFALDIETHGFNWMKDDIICIAFSNTRGKSYVLPWVVGTDEFYDKCKKEALSTKKREVIETVDQFCELFNLERPKFFWDNDKVKEELQTLLADETISKILHNFVFDYKFLEREGLVIKGTIYDTMIMHYLTDERKGGHDLKTLADKYTEYGDYEKSLEAYKFKSKGKTDTYGIIPIQILLKYAGTDADATLQLFERLYPIIEKEGMLTLYLSFLVPLAFMLLGVERRGFKIDLKYLEELKVTLAKLIKEYDEKIEQYTKNVVGADSKNKEAKGVNVNSYAQLRYLLYDYLRLPVVKLTEKGAPATDADTLEELKSMHPVPEMLVTRKKYMKLLGTYVNGQEECIWEDGRVHPHFHITGTETGRLSSSNPNCQNQPRPVPELVKQGINIRNLFVSPDFDNYYLVEVDYSQAELRLIAEYSRDANLYGAFINGRDPHAELAVRIYYSDKVHLLSQGVDPNTIVTKEQRQNGKTANFSLMYGKAPDNFAKENGLSIEEALTIHKVYWETYTGITAWKNRVLQEARQTLEFKSAFGRKRRMQKLNSQEMRLVAEAEREGVNFVIQAQASDYTLFSILKIMKEIREKKMDVHPIAFVHDSGVFEVHKSHIQEFLTMLKERMTKLPGLTVPMEIECKVGYRWGSLKEWININGIWQQKPEKSA